MQNLKLKNIVLVISATILTFAMIYAYNIFPRKTLGIIYSADFSFFTALRFSLTLLILLIPFKNFGLKLLVCAIWFFLLGFVVPLVHFSDAGDLVYIMYFILTFIIIATIYALTDSLSAPSNGIVYSLSAVLILIAGVLLFTSISWTKAIAMEYTKFYASDYLQCHGDDVTVDSFEKICSNLTGYFWEEKYGSSYQKTCFTRANSRKAGYTAGGQKNCNYLEQYSGDKYKFSNFLTHFFDTKSEIGLPSNS